MSAGMVDTWEMNLPVMAKMVRVVGCMLIGSSNIC